jgi:hypothetical protein
VDIYLQFNDDLVTYMRSEFIYSNDYNVHSVGTSKTARKSFIYLPVNFSWRTVDDIPDSIKPLFIGMYVFISMFQVHASLTDATNQPHDLSIENRDMTDRKSLLSCLLLSERAKRFVIQRELNR